MPDTWDELDALCEELHALDSVWAERHASVTAEMDTLSPLRELLDRHEQDLAPAAALEQVRARLLGGAGVIQHTSLDFGLQRLAVLAWPPAADPRPELSAAAGEYRVEVWLYVSEQGRPRVRVVGAKRLEAVLPAPAERFRAVLLGAIRSPAFTPLPSPAESESLPSASVDAPDAAAEPPPDDAPEVPAQ